MSRLIVKFPTRNRPDKFKAVFERYIGLLSGKHDVEFVLSMDADDPSMNNQQIHEWLCMKARRNRIRWFYGNSKTKVEACNANLESVEGDVLLLASDDMVPLQQNYDDFIFQAFSMTYPDFDGAIKFWDGFRSKDDPMLTLPIIGLPLYRRFGYIYHPDYTSLYCDEEQTEVLRALGKLSICKVCIIQHQWTPEHFDLLHARNENKEMYALDGAVFERRKKAGFDLHKIAAGDMVRAVIV
jgi:hypothetical protein